MNTSKLFLLTCLVVFGVVFTSSGQTQLGTGAGTGGTFYTNIGMYAGQLNTGSQNVFLGTNSGWKSGLGSSNVFLGMNTGQYFNGIENVIIGTNAAQGGTTAAPAGGSSNVIIGQAAGYYSLGSNSTIIGRDAGRNANGNSNCFYGYRSGYSVYLNSSGGSNSFYGSGAGEQFTSGSGNSFFGAGSGTGISTGINNTILGRASSLAGNLSNTIILADGANQQRLYIHSNGFAGIGLGNNVIPLNTLEIKSLAGSPTVSGLRLTNLPNTSTSITNSTNKVLTVDINGDVILVNDISGGITATCSTANFVPVNSSTAGVLACSQIYDNGTSVGIGTTGPFNYTWTGGLTGSTLPATSGTLKLDINGVTRGLAFMATSDRKFKKDIKPIESALEKVMGLDGKTYNWRKEEFKDINFSDELQYGLIAQEVQKIIPSLVIKTEKGDLAMNYTGLIPVLIEAMKEQQIQINDLKNQISENFKSQNDDLIKLENTKIISVSPNPSSDVIAVSLNIEKSVQNAKLQVYDLKGALLSSLNINERENNITKTLQKDNFGQGIYIVSLVVNSKSIDTKKIVFN